ncbi:hypothetical protein A0O34_14315 [Chryseobacterium glaciei]|uniref:Uncharacterized protein n=1 Tax=Chryseobacterium glaciei TaxID=1685010 RepID=A0A172XXC6_9FLAO|nr:hypothetical protein [Chryseobacterium glaciei]ANF51604.1 hypothetical protein A0O34_14315 [Chryseobacterium glaciei]
MIKEKLKQILSLNGISVLIGIIGGILGIFSIFIDWNSQISIKWFAALTIFFSFLLLITLILVFEMYKNYKVKIIKNHKVIQFLEENLLLLVENNNSLEFSQTVSIYYIINNFQVLLAQGFVENIQENFVQIKITQFEQNFLRNYSIIYEKIINNDKSILDLIIIKNYIRYNE